MTIARLTCGSVFVAPVVIDVVFIFVLVFVIVVGLAVVVVAIFVVKSLLTYVCVAFPAAGEEEFGR